jgi:hypothetical protein
MRREDRRIARRLTSMILDWGKGGDFGFPLSGSSIENPFAWTRIEALLDDRRTFWRECVWSDEIASGISAILTPNE